MDKVVFIIIGTILIFVAPILAIIVVDKFDRAKLSWYDDAKDSNYAPEKRANQIYEEPSNKRASYLSCMENINIIGSDNVCSSMRKIDEYIASYKLEQFDRFYTIYCKELDDTLNKIKDCKCSSLYYNLVTEARATYGSIFSKMLTDIEAFIKNNSTSIADIEGIKNFAKINGDFDEKYNVKAHDTTLTASANDLRNSISSAIKAGNARSARLNALDLESGKSWDFFSGWDSMSKEAKRDYIREVQYLNMIVKDKTGDMFSSFDSKHIDLIECTFKDIAEHFSDGTVFTYCGVPVTIYDVSEVNCENIYHTHVTIQYPNGMVETIEYDKRGGRRL